MTTDTAETDARANALVVEVVGRFTLLKTPYEWGVCEDVSGAAYEDGVRYDYAWYASEADARPVIEAERMRLAPAPSKVPCSRTPEGDIEIKTIGLPPCDRCGDPDCWDYYLRWEIRSGITLNSRFHHTVSNP